MQVSRRWNEAAGQLLGTHRICRAAHDEINNTTGADRLEVAVVWVPPSESMLESAPTLALPKLYTLSILSPCNFALRCPRLRRLDIWVFTWASALAAITPTLTHLSVDVPQSPDFGSSQARHQPHPNIQAFALSLSDYEIRGEPGQVLPIIFPGLRQLHILWAELQVETVAQFLCSTSHWQQLEHLSLRVKDMDGRAEPVLPFKLPNTVASLKVVSIGLSKPGLVQSLRDYIDDLDSDSRLKSLQYIWTSSRVQDGSDEHEGRDALADVCAQRGIAFSYTLKHSTANTTANISAFACPASLIRAV